MIIWQLLKYQKHWSKNQQMFHNDYVESAPKAVSQSAEWLSEVHHRLVQEQLCHWYVRSSPVEEDEEDIQSIWKKWPVAMFKNWIELEAF